MKKMIKLIMMTLTMITLIGIIPVSAKSHNRMEPDIYNTYKDFINTLYYDIDGLDILITEAETEKDIKHLKQGLAYVRDLYRYYEIKLEKKFIKFVKADPDKYGEKNYTLSKEDKKFKKTHKLSKKNKYYKFFSNAAKDAKKWYKNALTELNADKIIYPFECDRIYKVFTEWETGTQVGTRVDGIRHYIYGNADAELITSIGYVSFEDSLDMRLDGITKKAEYKKNNTKPKFEEYAQSAEFARKVGVIKNPEEYQTVKYCFSEPYIDIYGTTHKFYTSLYDKDGNEHVIEIFYFYKTSDMNRRGINIKGRVVGVIYQEDNFYLTNYETVNLFFDEIGFND